MLKEKNNHLNQFKGFEVKVTYPKVDYDSLRGLLLEVNDDHLVLKDDTDDYKHYIQLDKIRGLTKNTKDITPEDTRKIPYTDKYRFVELLKEYENTWVKLTREGVKHEKGFISKVYPNHILFIQKDELTLIPISQIAYLSSKYVIVTDKGKCEEEDKKEKYVKKPVNSLPEKKEMPVDKKEKTPPVKKEKKDKSSPQIKLNIPVSHTDDTKECTTHTTSDKKVAVYRSSKRKRKRRYS